MTRKVQPGTWKIETVRKDTAHGKEERDAPSPYKRKVGTGHLPMMVRRGSA